MDHSSNGRQMWAGNSGELWGEPMHSRPSKLLRAAIQVSVAMLAIGAVAALWYGVFSMVCTQHDWTTFWRYMMRAGCA